MTHDKSADRAARDAVHTGEALGAHLAGDAEEPSAQMKAWLDASEHNRALFAEASDPAELASRHRFYASVDADDELRRYKRRRRRRAITRRSLAAAASLAVLIAVGYLMHVSPDAAPTITKPLHPGGSKAYLMTQGGETIPLDSTNGLLIRGAERVTQAGGQGLVYEKSDEPAAADVIHNRLITPRGGEYILTLSDGTRVWLNAESTLEYPVEFTAGERTVSLTGEAYFEVAADSLNPFVVSTVATRVKVYGTRFSIRAYPDSPNLTVLVSGSVGVQGAEGKEIKLTPEQLAEFDAEGRLKGVRAVDHRTYTGWKDGYFVFENQTLEEILTELSRWYDTEVVYADRSVKNYRFTGHIERYDDISAILNPISRMVGVSFSVEGRTISVGR